MKKISIILCIIATFLLISCNNATTRLEYSLQNAGSNRIELEKWLLLVLKNLLRFLNNG